jgi:hypothetical protein
MIRTLACVVLILALPLSAAEMTGTWAGSLEVAGPNGQTQSDRCYMILKQSGMRISGVIGPDKSIRWSIQNGKAEGAMIPFAVFPLEGGRLAFDLRLAGGPPRGEASGENQGLSFKAKVDLTRASD